jgi:subtilisin family serine protease
MKTTRFLCAVLLALSSPALVLASGGSGGGSGGGGGGGGNCSGGAAGDLPGVDPRVDGEGLLRLVDDPGVTIGDFLAAFNASHPVTPASVVDAIESRRIYRFQVDLSGVPPAQVDAVLDAIEADLELQPPPQVVWIEFNYRGGAPEGKSGSIWVTGIADAPLFGTQFAGSLLGLDTAHGLSMGAATAVAVLDTGIDATHPALQSMVLSNGFNFVAGNTDTADAGNGIDDDGDGTTDEMTGHGTFVAGLIALTAPDVALLPVVVLDDENGTTDLWTMVEGMFFAIDRGVEVINMSLTTTYRSRAVEDAIDEAWAHGIAIVAAAGNFDRCEPRENPAMQDTDLEHDTIGVAATKIDDVKASFSNFSDRLMLSAPGGNELLGGAAGSGPDPAASIVGPLPGGEWAVWEGTSFATAFVSGAVAVIRAQHPEWPASGATLAAIEGILAGTAVNIDAQNPAHAGQLGFGRLDVGAAASASPPAPALGDLDNDGAVDVQDLVALIAAWGQVHSSADLNSDGNVGVADLVLLIVNWS